MNPSIKLFSIDTCGSLAQLLMYVWTELLMRTLMLRRDDYVLHT